MAFWANPLGITSTYPSEEVIMFCSTSITGYLVRGVLALAALLGGVALTPHFWPALGLFPFAIYLMRGCPICWLMGLLEALRTRHARPDAI